MPDLLLFSDVHGDLDACRSLVRRSADVDVVVGAGDFCNMRRGLQRVIDVLAEIETPTVLVPGNAESAEELRAACASWEAVHVLHGEGCSIEGTDFHGIGGGIPVTPFGAWSYDFTEGRARDLLRGVPKGGVLVSHSPPRGLVDRDSSGTSLGSTAVREAVQNAEPALVVCGHIHGSWEEEDTLGETLVVNAGPNGLVRTTA